MEEMGKEQGRGGSLVTIFQPLALRHHHRYHRCAEAKRVDLPWIGLGAVGDEECPGRDEGRQTREPAARPRTDRPRDRGDGDHESWACTGALLEEDHRPADAWRVRGHYGFPREWQPTRGEPEWRGPS